MRQKVVEATQAHQQGSAAQDYALAVADVLEGVLLGLSIPEAVQQASLTAPASTQGALRKAQQHAHATQADVVEVRAFLFSSLNGCSRAAHFRLAVVVVRLPLRLIRRNVSARVG